MTNETKKSFGGRQDGAGRPALPPDKKRSVRIPVNVTETVAERIKAKGGASWAAEVLTKAALEG